MTPPISMNNNPVTRLLNPLIKALNTNDWMPKVLIFMLGEKFVNHCSDNAHLLIRWFLVNIWRALKAKKEGLPAKAKPNFTTSVNHQTITNTGME